MKDWDLLQFGERARIALDCFPTLEPDVAHATIQEWSKNEYPPTWQGEQQAIHDLMGMLRYASLSNKQRDQERERITTLVRTKLK